MGRWEPDFKRLQSDMWIVILPADKGRSTVIVNPEDYLGNCKDHMILLPTLKPKTTKGSEGQENELYYYLTPTDSPVPTFYGQPKMLKPVVPMPCCFLQWLLVVQS